MTALENDWKRVLHLWPKTKPTTKMELIFWPKTKIKLLCHFWPNTQMKTKPII